VPPKHWFTRASDASPWWLGLPALAGCGSLPRSAGLGCSPQQPPRQAGRSDLCSQHQHGSAGHSACFVIRVTQLSWISPGRGNIAGSLCRVPSGPGMPSIGSGHCTGGSRRHPHTLRLAGDRHCIDAAGAGHAAWVCFCKLANQWPFFPLSYRKWSCVEMFLCICVLAGDVLSARARQGAAARKRRRQERRLAGACANNVSVSQD